MQICPPVADTNELRRAVIAACLRLSDLGFCIGTWGNVSVRVTDGLLITPSRMDYTIMQPEDLVVVSWKGEKLRGRRVPSSETELHRLLLERRPDLGAIVHSHSPHASALAAAHRDLPVCLEDMAQIIGGTVHCARYTPGGRHRDLAEAACAAIGPDAAAVLLANHGPVVGGRNLDEAVIAAQVLEKAARVYLYAESVGGGCPIAPELVAEERHRFFFKYGKEDPIEVKG
jgi:L-fuculose-phosphate aldolase